MLRAEGEQQAVIAGKMVEHGGEEAGLSRSLTQIVWIQACKGQKLIQPLSLRRQKSERRQCQSLGFFPANSALRAAAPRFP